MIVEPQAGGDQLFSWQHGAMLATLLAPFLLFWMDSRRQGEKHHRETTEQSMQMHHENQVRLTRIETQLRPIAEWWNQARGEQEGP